MAHPNPIIYSDYSDCPDFLNEFLIYLKTIRGLSLNTVEAYYIDLRLFLRYIIQKNKDSINNDTIDQVYIKNFDIYLLFHLLTEVDYYPSIMREFPRNIFPIS